MPARAAAVAPAGRALDGAEHLLVKCRPLSAQWGLERFGLADPTVLQAIEVCEWGGGRTRWGPRTCGSTWWMMGPGPASSGMLELQGALAGLACLQVP